MNCEQVKQHWHLFHDSEGDAEMHLQINEHLAMCPDCARWYFQQSQLEEALVDKLCVGQPSKLMWDRIQSRCVDKQPAGQGWFFAKGIFGVAALVVFAAFGLAWLGISPIGPGAKTTSDLAGLSVELHGKLASGREALKLTSDSPQEVEDYVRTLVSFPVRCPPREDAGFLVAGGGVCHFEQDPVAYVVGDVDGKRVTVFIMARESLANYPAQDKALRRQATLAEDHGDCGVVIGELDQNLILVVGPVDSGRLARVLKAYGTYPDHAPRAELPARPGRLSFDVWQTSPHRRKESCAA